MALLRIIKLVSPLAFLCLSSSTSFLHFKHSNFVLSGEKYTVLHEYVDAVLLSLQEEMICLFHVLVHILGHPTGKWSKPSGLVCYVHFQP